MLIFIGYDNRNNRTAYAPFSGTSRGFGWTYDLANRVLTETNGLNQQTVFTYDNAGRRFPLTDALGSVYALTDSTGAIVRSYGFEVYGERADLGGTGPTTDRAHTGRWLDANGTLEHRDRQRNPKLGGWLTPDRAGGVDGPNLYGFVRENPISFIDPEGTTLTVYVSGPLVDIYDSEGAIVATATPSHEIEDVLRDLTSKGYSLGFWRLFNATLTEGVINQARLRRSGMSQDPVPGITGYAQCYQAPLAGIVAVVDFVSMHQLPVQQVGRRIYRGEIVAHELGHAMERIFRVQGAGWARDEQWKAHLLLSGGDIVRAQATFQPGHGDEEP